MGGEAWTDPGEINEKQNPPRSWFCNGLAWRKGKSLPSMSTSLWLWSHCVACGHFAPHKSCSSSSRLHLCSLGKGSRNMVGCWHLSGPGSGAQPEHSGSVLSLAIQKHLLFWTDTGNAQICNPFLQHFGYGHIPTCSAWGGIKQKGHETNSRKLSELGL